MSRFSILSDCVQVIVILLCLQYLISCRGGAYSPAQREEAWKFIVETRTSFEGKARFVPDAGIEPNQEAIRARLVDIIKNSCKDGPPCDGLQVSHALSLLAEHVDQQEAVRLSGKILTASTSPFDALFTAGQLLVKYDRENAPSLFVAAIRRQPDQGGSMVSSMGVLLFDKPAECREIREILEKHLSKQRNPDAYLTAVVRDLPCDR